MNATIQTPTLLSNSLLLHFSGSCVKFGRRVLRLEAPELNTPNGTLLQNPHSWMLCEDANCNYPRNGYNKRMNWTLNSLLHSEILALTIISSETHWRNWKPNELVLNGGIKFLKLLLHQKLSTSPTATPMDLLHVLLHHNFHAQVQISPKQHRLRSLWSIGEEPCGEPSFHPCWTDGRETTRRNHSSLTTRTNFKLSQIVWSSSTFHSIFIQISMDFIQWHPFSSIHSLGKYPPLLRYCFNDLTF